MNNVINMDEFKSNKGGQELYLTIRMPYSEYERLSHQVRLLRLRAEEAQERLLQEIQATIRKEEK